MSEINDRDWTSTGRAAAALGVDERTVRSWIRRGIVPATRTPGTRAWRVSVAWLAEEVARQASTLRPAG